MNICVCHPNTNKTCHFSAAFKYDIPIKKKLHNESAPEFAATKKKQKNERM